jgi:hypothetical protein
MQERVLKCRKCKKEGAIEIEIRDKNTREMIQFRCGRIGFCKECLPIVQKKNEHRYIYVPMDVVLQKNLTSQQIVEYVQLFPSLVRDGMVFLKVL